MEQWREDLYLSHYGVKGMKWGVRRYDRLAKKYADKGNLNKSKYYGRLRDIKKTGHIDIHNNDSKITKQVKNDWNNLSKRQFSEKYAVSKGTYAKRIAKGGDPFRKGAAKNLNKKGRKIASNVAEKEVSLIKKSNDPFNRIANKYSWWARTISGMERNSLYKDIGKLYLNKNNRK